MRERGLSFEQAVNYQLRLPDGPALSEDDALLGAFGACVVAVISGADDHEALQDDAFAPGRRVTLLEEGADHDGDPVVGVWDAEGLRRAGHLETGSRATRWTASTRTCTSRRSRRGCATCGSAPAPNSGAATPSGCSDRA